MKTQHLRLFLLAIILTTVASAGFAQTGASATWRVQKYDLDVSLPQSPTDRNVTVRARLTVKNVSSSPAGSLTLRISPAADVSVVKINDAAVDPVKSEEKIGAVSLQRIATRFTPAAPGVTVTATVDYKIAVKDNSAVAAVSQAASQMLPLSFWYPTPNSWYFTKGADVGPTRIKVNAPGLSTVSSGVAVDGAYDQKLNSQPFFVTGSWDTIESGGVAVLVPKGYGADAAKRAGELAALTSDARTFFSGILGAAPDTPIRLVGSRRGGGFAGAGTMIVDEGVFRRPGIDSLTAMNIAEGVAKMWLGSSVSVNGEGGGVISEGLARYLATQFIESKFGKDVADIERLRQRTAYASMSRRDAPMATVSPLDDVYFPVVANKGAMVWRLLARRVGKDEFAAALRAAAADGSMTLAELRDAFASQKELLDYFFDQVNEMDLLAGVPQQVGADTRVALRNSGNTDVTVDVVGTTASQERVTATATIKAGEFADVVFKSKAVVRAEVDADKLYPQTDYSNDVAPRDTTDSDPLLAAKRAFDKQDFAGTEKTARVLLSGLPRFDDLRIFLARALLAQGRTADAEREFKAVIAEKLPTARSLAWANVGLAEAASKSGQPAQAKAYADAAIMIDADYGASLAARTLRNSLRSGGAPDGAAKTFFADFDKAVAAKRKADIDAMIVPGEISRFASGVAGSAESWQTQVTQTDMLGPNTMIVETNMNIRLLNKTDESGIAVYRLIKAPAGWKIAAVDMFEVR